MTTPISFLIWADIPAEHEAGFNEWYNREHARDRVLGIPGFIQARRFVAVEGVPKYAALYDVSGSEVFQNDAYIAMRRTPDANSQKFIPQFRNVIRHVGSIVADAAAIKGVAEGTWVRFTGLTALAPAAKDTTGWQEVVAGLVRRPGIMRARVFGAVPQLTDGVVRNMRGAMREGMRGPDRFPDLLVMVEGATEAEVAGIEADLTRAIAARPGLEIVDSARMQQLMRIAVGS